MSPEEKHDIIESFQVMDEEKTGEIDVNQFHTLCLGLGHDLIERHELEVLFPPKTKTVTLELALEILEKFPRDRREEVSRGFQLVSNQSNKITPQHLMQLSEEMGDPLTLQEAQAMMPSGFWSRADFERLLSPPSSS